MGKTKLWKFLLCMCRKLHSFFWRPLFGQYNSTIGLTGTGLISELTKPLLILTTRLSFPHVTSIDLFSFFHDCKRPLKKALKEGPRKIFLNTALSLISEVLRREWWDISSWLLVWTPFKVLLFVLFFDVSFWFRHTSDEEGFASSWQTTLNLINQSRQNRSLYMAI